MIFVTVPLFTNADDKQQLIDKGELATSRQPFNRGPEDGGHFNRGPEDGGPFNRGPEDEGPFNRGPEDGGPFNAQGMNLPRQITNN